VILSLDLKEKKMIAKPMIISRGFVYMKEHQELMQKLTDEVTAFTANVLSHQKTITSQILKREIIRFLSDSIIKKTDRNPNIMPVIMTF
jgi:ribonuclease J